MGKSITIAVIAATMGISLLSLSTTTTLFQSGENISEYQEDLLAREIAHTAQNLAMLNIEQNILWRDGFPSVEYQGGSYEVSVMEADNGRLEVNTTARFSDSEYQIRSVVSPRYLEGSMIADVPASVVSYSGNSFTISGRDINSAGEPGPGPHVHAVAASSKDVADSFREAISGNQASNVSGALGNKDVVHKQTRLDLDAVHAYLKANATPGYVFNGDHKFTGNTDFGSPSDPVIMVVNGNADFAGTINGYGILLIEGELQIAAGNVKWEGLVFVNSKDDVMVTHTTADITGNAQIYGSLIMRQPKNQDHLLGFSIKGRAKIQYSTEALERVASMVPMIQDGMEIILLQQWEGLTRQHTPDQTHGG